MSRFVYWVTVFSLPLFLIGCNKQAHDKWAENLDVRVSVKRIDDTMQALASRPHRAGTESNRKVGETIANMIRSMGIKTWTDSFQVTLEEPADQRVWLNGNELDLREKAFPQDPYSSAASTEVPFLAYSADSDLEAEVVYGNFGTREDYAALKKAGIVVQGKIVLLRAQGICRGMKEVIAEEQGAAGMLLYPDPQDQGFRKAGFPDGPFLNPWTAMRGSMERYFVSPGDPVDAQGQKRPGILPAIPAVPIGGKNAQLIFQAMGGEPATTWKGGLPVSYRFGPGPAKVRIVLQGQWNKKTIQNVYGLIPGTHPEEGTILVGSHYDAWVYGAADPISGVATILEAMQIFAQDTQSGWKPRRNLMFAFWDGEEYGMHGSAAWVRQNVGDKQTRIAAYINIDTAVRAHEFLGNIMPGLRFPMDNALSVIKDPDAQVPLSEIRPQYGLPGFSSDTSAFLGLTGIPVAEIGFGRWYSVYHSIYDNLTWYRRFNDPGYRYTVALTKVLSVFVRDLSSSNLLPYRFTEIADYGQRYVVQHPTAQPVSLLGVEAKRYEAAAYVWEQIDPSSIPEDALSRINGLLFQAIQVFSESSTPEAFGKSQVLVGPSPDAGCTADNFEMITAAIASRNPMQLADETSRVQNAFSQSRQLLEEVVKIARSKE